MILSSRYALVLAAAFLVAAVAYAVRGFTTGATLDFVLAALWVSCFVVYALHARRARRAEKADVLACLRGAGFGSPLEVEAGIA